MKDTPTVICLTPVKNEAWILDRFLRCASLWADHIIIADQCSDDGSREIAVNYPKVTLIDNPSTTFNEPERQKLLLKVARGFPGPRLLIALDADEMLTANFLNSREWQDIQRAPVGTIIYFRWVNLRPGLRSYWSPDNHRPFGIIDDESEHVGGDIHSPRIPINDNAPKLKLQDIGVLHYQYSDWRRMESKHRWYQCWERLTHPERHPIDIYRQYHHMYAIPKDEHKPLPREWIAGYEQQGIEMTSVRAQPAYWWDKEVLRWFKEYGVEHFRREAIWDIDWIELARITTVATNGQTFHDPRKPLDKSIHRWLRSSQSSPGRLDVRLVNKAIRLLGW